MRPQGNNRVLAWFTGILLLVTVSCKTSSPDYWAYGTLTGNLNNHAFGPGNTLIALIERNSNLVYLTKSNYNEKLWDLFVSARPYPLTNLKHGKEYRLESEPGGGAKMTVAGDYLTLKMGEYRLSEITDDVDYAFEVPNIERYLEEMTNDAVSLPLDLHNERILRDAEQNRSTSFKAD